MHKMLHLSSHTFVELFVLFIDNLCVRQHRRLRVWATSAIHCDDIHAQPIILHLHLFVNEHIYCEN